MPGKKKFFSQPEPKLHRFPIEYARSVLARQAAELDKLLFLFGKNK
jgi:hypothetical protein